MLIFIGEHVCVLYVCMYVCICYTVLDIKVFVLTYDKSNLSLDVGVDGSGLLKLQGPIQTLERQRKCEDEYHISLLKKKETVNVA